MRVEQHAAAVAPFEAAAVVAIGDNNAHEGAGPSVNTFGQLSGNAHGFLDADAGCDRFMPTFGKELINAECANHGDGCLNGMSDEGKGEATPVTNFSPAVTG